MTIMNKVAAVAITWGVIRSLIAIQAVVVYVVCSMVMSNAEERIKAGQCLEYVVSEGSFCPIEKDNE